MFGGEYPKGFPRGSDGKESTSIAGDLALIPGFGRSTGGGHGIITFLPSSKCKDQTVLTHYKKQLQQPALSSHKKGKLIKTENLSTISALLQSNRKKKSCGKIYDHISIYIRKKMSVALPPVRRCLTIPAEMISK